MISTLLVANRGEIACRIFRTCRAAGISTVAVYADPDADALHVREADLAVRLPGAAAVDTYLRADLVVRAALAAGADAVHPGYGFLSENADFARAVTDAGLLWVGPPPEAIEAMASKTRAKELMGSAPLKAADVTAADLPVLVKAAAGGGGRGMRVVRELSELVGELAAARSEATAAFGDGEVFVEPYVERGRHVEVQVLADAHGTVWALGTRDCSLQRRHQKVVEECPAPGLPAELVAELHAASVKVARTVGYVGAGTVEFLISPDGRAHFLEVNTRLQVEHPVTEAVFGLDLVAWQLAVAEGARLPVEPPPAVGHAVEARLYAEDPAAGWAPQTGVLHELSVPVGQGVPTLRVDTGYGPGDRIPVHYDPLLAKVIAWAPTRAAAVRRLADALRRARLHGPVTNRDLLVGTLTHPEFLAGDGVDTGFYERHLAELTRPLPGEEHAAVAAALARAAPAGGDGLPGRLGAWRNLPSQPQSKAYDGRGGHHEVRYRTTARDGVRCTVESPPGARVVSVAPDRVALEVDGVVRTYAVREYGDGRVYVDGPTGSYALVLRPRFPEPHSRHEPGSLLAPMPGTVVRIADGLAAGAQVVRGQPLVWLEAMKMEHRIVAPASGVLTALHAAPGAQVEVGALLAVVHEEQHGEQREEQHGEQRGEQRRDQQEHPAEEES
ncbi:biotin carboxylase N-terminal domain-containing protein [Streptomyces sp. NPDC048057]|uniref:acetyl/propionyl/methylcrotonyl-CoA carboxylase subunit alpha n=1 Tax=Streptomyces sp. NPDC048057 TaxID=3155628 RepID=UPI0033DB56CD